VRLTFQSSIAEVKIVRTFVGKNTGVVSDLVAQYYEDNIYAYLLLIIMPVI